MVDASLVLDAIVAVSIAAGAFFAVIELRDLKRDRRIEYMLQASAHVATREFMDAFCRIWRSDATDAKELEEQVPYSELCMVAEYFDAIAHLATEGLVDKRTLVGYFSYDYIWKKMSPWVLAERRAANSPEMYEDIERLAKSREKEGGYLATGKSP